MEDTQRYTEGPFLDNVLNTNYKLQTYLRRSMFRQLMEEGQGQERESGSVKKIREEGKGQWRGLWKRAVFKILLWWKIKCGMFCNVIFFPLIAKVGNHIGAFWIFKLEGLLLWRFLLEGVVAYLLFRLNQINLTTHVANRLPLSTSVSISKTHTGSISSVHS